MGAATAPTTADFARDVVNAQVLEAEQKVYLALRKIPHWKLCDVRGKHIAYDFEAEVIGQRKTVDVKYDRYIERTGRVVFERLHRHDSGETRAGWGYSSVLDYIAVVGQRMETAWLYSVPAFRAYVDAGIASGAAANWKLTEPRNRQGYVTVGYAIAQTELKAAGVYRMHFGLSGDPLADLKDW